MHTHIHTYIQAHTRVYIQMERIEIQQQLENLSTTQNDCSARPLSVNLRYSLSLALSWACSLFERQAHTHTHAYTLSKIETFFLSFDDVVAWPAADIDRRSLSLSLCCR